MIRKKISAKLKAQIALEAIKGNETIDSFSQRFGVHPTQIKKWKSELLAHSEKVFSKENKNSVKFSEKTVVALERMVGQQAIEIDFLKKTSRSSEGRKSEND